MKDLPYITHDFGARNDPKLMDLQMDLGGQGLGIFWCLVEMLWENGGVIPANYRSIAFALRWCKPSEVEKVVTGYGLFEVVEGFITSHSATARINEMRTRFGARSESSRKASAARWGKVADADGVQTQSERNANAMRTESGRNADAMPLTNILTNKQTNSHNNTRPTAAEVFDLLFFENMKDPSGEAARFLDYYDANGWTYTDGSPVTDWETAARAWKPLKQGKRYKDELLRWYRAVWNAAQGRLPDAHGILLEEFGNIRYDGPSKVFLTYRTTAAAQAASRFILDNDLVGDIDLDFRVAN